MKRLVTVGTVYIYIYTDTLANKIVRNDKSFRIPENMRNLEENCEK